MKKQENSNSNEIVQTSDNKYLNLEQEIEKLAKKVQELEDENIKLLCALEETGGTVGRISDSEIICVQQIRRLKELSEFGDLSESQVKIFDILYRNLRILRGQEVPNQKGKKEAKKLSAEQLLKMVVKG